jgi:hypothetical protein
MSDVKYDERWFEGLHGADLLAEKLCQVINIEGDKDGVDAGERFYAALMLVADLVSSTQCASCRAAMAKSARKVLPDLLKQAMQKPVTDPECLRLQMPHLH